MRITNPATEKVIQEIQEDNQLSVNEKFTVLKVGQPLWASVPLRERIQCISRFKDLLELEKDALANTLTEEMGKPLQQSYNELNSAANRVSYFIDNAEEYLSEEWVVTKETTREKIVYEPLGVIANISAWNYPFLVGVNVFIPGLLGGNAVMYKPSEFATLSGHHIVRLLYKAGVPKHAIQVIVGRGQIGEHLLDLPLNGYFFTGSFRTGKYIATKVAPKMVPCQLELGGKDPLYVMEDVEDIDQTAAAALEGVVYNNGQSCCAVERIYVHEKVYNKFVTSYTRQAAAIVIGDPMDKLTGLGPLSRKAQVDFLLSQIEDAVDKGAKLLTGGHALNRPGYFIEPTVLVNVNHSMRIMTEESFGPVVGIQSVVNDDDAVQCMLDTEYGLTAAVYSKNFERANSIFTRMNTGTVYWNCCDRVSPGLPWSGRKHSGLGTTLSYQGIRVFVQPKAYHLRG